MTTYVIGLFVVALFYGLFWNNRPAREIIRVDNPKTKRDEDAVLPGRGNSPGVLPGRGPTRTGQVLPGRQVDFRP
jgi:hypothetical protein